MNIYFENTIITQEMVDSFVPTYLMIKMHRKTGLLYLCKTVSKDFQRYKGSGTLWRNHIKKYGTEFVDTIWFKLFNDIHELVYVSLYLSQQFDIVNARDRNGNKLWANLMFENGIQGFAPGRKMCAEQKLYLKSLYTGKTRSDEIKQKIKNNMSDCSGIHNGFYGKTHSEDAKVKCGNANRGRDTKSLSGKENISRSARLRMFKKDTTIYTFENVKSGVIISCSRHDFMKQYNINQNRVSAIVTGQQKTAAGWRIIR